jgi:hypothetical protein
MPAKGFKKQFCKRGHDTSICGRNRSNHCNDCSKEFKKTDAYLDGLKKWRKEHQKDTQEYSSLYWQNHKEERNDYRKNHPEIVAMINIKNQTNRSLRVVRWTDWDGIKKVYKYKAKEMSVDHIIPLQGELVSGLHVSWNLQYLSHSKNSSKHNKCNLLEASKWYGKILEEARLK